MADLSKVRIGSSDYNLKDATARASMTTLLGSHDLEALKAGAWTGVNTAWTTESSAMDNLPTAAAVKDYVDAQIGAIHNFDVVVCSAVAAEIPAGAIYKDDTQTITGTMAASSATMYKLYMVKNTDAGSGAYMEYITIKTGDDTYVWEMIGTTVVDLTNYVKKTTQIAGVSISDGISKEALQTALGLEDLAYATNATGSTSYTPAGSITGSAISGGSVTLNAFTQTSTGAAITSADYTPAGTISGAALSGGSISVTLKESADKEATLSKASYTPAGTITASSSFSALTNATFQESTGSGAVQIKGTVSAPTIALTSSSMTVATGLTGGKVASFTEGAFTPAAFSDGFYTAGSSATWTGMSYTGGSLGEASTSSFVTAAMTAQVGTGDDAETLIISAASTGTAVTAQGTFSAATIDWGTFNGGSATVIDTTKFSGGSKAADTFEANELQAASTDSFNKITAATADAPTFTGNSYNLNLTADTAMKSASFAGTEVENFQVTGVQYKTAEISDATFTGQNASLSFVGTKEANLKVTAVTYDKATANGATFEGTVASLSFAGTTATISISVTPDE